VAIIRPFGEIVASPFETIHIDSKQSKLAKMLKSLKGETKIVMESTSSYHLPIAYTLHDARMHINAQHTHNNNIYTRQATTT